MHYISIDTKNAKNIAFESDDPAEMMLVINFNDDDEKRPFIQF